MSSCQAAAVIHGSGRRKDTSGASKHLVDLNREGMLFCSHGCGSLQIICVGWNKVWEERSLGGGLRTSAARTTFPSVWLLYGSPVHLHPRPADGNANTWNCKKQQSGSEKGGRRRLLETSAGRCGWKGVGRAFCHASGERTANWPTEHTHSFFFSNFMSWNHFLNIAHWDFKLLAQSLKVDWKTSK